MVVVLHQPNSKLLECIDDVMIVTEGKVLYNGPLNSLVETFKEVGAECPQYYNRADFGNSYHVYGPLFLIAVTHIS